MWVLLNLLVQAWQILKGSDPFYSVVGSAVLVHDKHLDVPVMGTSVQMTAIFSTRLERDLSLLLPMQMVPAKIQGWREI